MANLGKKGTPGPWVGWRYRVAGGQVDGDEVNAGSGSRSTRRSASSYQRGGVGFGTRWPWKVLSWFACDGRRTARRDTRLLLAGWYGMPASCSMTGVMVLL